jgi:hypothetical protein
MKMFDSRLLPFAFIVFGCCGCRSFFYYKDLHWWGKTYCEECYGAVTLKDFAPSELFFDFGFFVTSLQQLPEQPVKRYLKKEVLSHPCVAQSSTKNEKT